MSSILLGRRIIVALKKCRRQANICWAFSLQVETCFAKFKKYIRTWFALGLVANTMFVQDVRYVLVETSI